MTDTDNIASELFGDEFDYEIDFDTLNIPDGKTPCKIIRVEFKTNMKEVDGVERPSRTLYVNMQVNAEDWPEDHYLQDYNGTFITGFIWLGREKIELMGKRSLAAFIEAVTGTKPEGNIDWNDYGLTKEADNKGVDHIYLTFFHGLPVGVNLVTEADKKTGVERQNVKNYIKYDDLTPLGESFEEPF